MPKDAYRIGDMGNDYLYTGKSRKNTGKEIESAVSGLAFQSLVYKDLQGSLIYEVLNESRVELLGNSQVDLQDES